MRLQEARIVLGVTGGIAAYKAVDLTSKLVQAGARVDVVMTEAATHFVAPLSFQALTHRPVHQDMFRLLDQADIAHVSLAQEADLLVVAPATANTLARLAHGLADDLLCAIALATEALLVVAPAMESHMFEHPATQENLARLQGWGAVVVGPGHGRLASGATGPGRLAEVAEILGTVRWVLGREGPLAGRRVVVTAGGTREPLDPVRFLSNHASGKMGFALAQAALDRGASVDLVTGPTWLSTPVGAERVAVSSAQEMHQAVMERLPQCDVLAMAAAVADYRPESAASHKIKKATEGLFLPLKRTVDILAQVAAQREETGRPAVVVGFAAESEDLIENARTKLRAKDMDLIVANDITAADSGFAVDTNRVTLIDREGNEEALPLLSKAEVAERVWEWVVQRL